MSGSKRLCIRSTCTVNVQAWETTLQQYECSLFYFFYFSGCRKINGHWMYFIDVVVRFYLTVCVCALFHWSKEVFPLAEWFPIFPIKPWQMVSNNPSVALWHVNLYANYWPVQSTFKLLLRVKCPDYSQLPFTKFVILLFLPEHKDMDMLHIIFPQYSRIPW